MCDKIHYFKLLTFIIGISTEVLHLFFEINILDKEPFFVFLDRFKHTLFHSVYPTVPCCECRKQSIAAPGKRGHLQRVQFDLLFDINNPIQDHHKTNGSNDITQHCACQISAKTKVVVSNMDITLICAIVKLCCPFQPGDPKSKWMKEIQDIRNSIAHKSYNELEKSDIDSKFSAMEKAVEGLAGVTCSTILKMTQKRISDFKKDDFSVEKIKSYIETSCDDLRKNLEAFLTEQKEESQEIKCEIIEQLQKHKDEISIDIKNIIFEEKTFVKSHSSHQPQNTEDYGESGYATSMTSDYETQIIQQTKRDPDRCYVEWKLTTPSKWNVDEIKKTLQNVSTMIGQWFKIEFVYIGSLIIETSVPKCVIQDPEQFYSAIKSFLETIVDICRLDTETQAVIKTAITIFNADFASGEATEPFWSDRQMSEKSDSEISEKDEDDFKIKKSKDRSCEPCLTVEKQTYADLWCMKCEESLCSQCAENHKMMKCLHDHRLVDIRKVPNMISIQSCCKIHVNMPYECFCVDHDLICCSECLKDIHQFCPKLVSLDIVSNVSNLSHAVQEFTVQTNTVLEQLNNLSENMQKNIEMIEDDTDKIKTEISEYLKDIRRISMASESQTTDIQKSLLVSMNKIKYEQLSYIKFQMKEMEDLISLTNEQREVLNFVKENGSEKQQVLLIYTSENFRHEIQKKVQILKQTIQQVGLIFNKGNYKSPSTGMIQPTQTPFNTMPERLEKSPYRFKFEAEINLEGLESTRIFGMTAAGINLIILCDSKYPRILVFEQTGTFKNVIETFYTCWDVSIIPLTNTAVASSLAKDIIQFIDMSKGKVIKGVEIKDSRQRGITCTSQNILVGGKKKINVLNQNGSKISEINISYSRGSIWYLSYGNERIFLSDGSDTIRCINMENDTVFSYYSHNLQVQRKMTIDDQGNVYVVGHKSNNIHRLSREGKFVDEILNEKDALNKPLAICFNKDYTKLFVSSFASILVFSVVK